MAEATAEAGSEGVATAEAAQVEATGAVTVAGLVVAGLVVVVMVVADWEVAVTEEGLAEAKAVVLAAVGWVAVGTGLVMVVDSVMEDCLAGVEVRAAEKVAAEVMARQAVKKAGTAGPS